MKMKPHAGLLLSAVFLFAASAFAAESKYLSPANTPDGTVLLPLPPQPDTPEYLADADEAYRVYSARTPDDLAKARSENRLTLFHFAESLGMPLNKGEFPKLEALIAQLDSDVRGPTDKTKAFFKRLRPYNAMPDRFKDPVDQEGMSSYSYPSGHSTRGTLYALVLAEVFPERRDALIAKGRLAGWYRVQGGVHFPLDIYAGRVWGQALFRAFMANPDFQKALSEVKDEVLAGTHK